jgi:large conductance mechanosensitive channel
MIKAKVNGFFEFIREQGVVGLAIGFVLGGSVSKLVNSLVQDIINPLLGPILGAAGDLNEQVLRFGGVEVKWGSFANNLIDFMIMAAVIYFVFKGLGLEKVDKPKKKKE